MLNNCKAKAFLASAALMCGLAQAQASVPSNCQGQPLSVEAQAASMPSECDGMAPACERIPKTPDDTVFAGRVIALTEVSVEMMIEGVCAQTTAQSVTLLVKESFSGSLPQTITVHAGYVNGYWFRPKETALVFAKKLSDGTLFVSGCKTKPMDTDFLRTKEDLAYLRSRDKLPPTGSLFGYTWVTPPPSVNDKAIAVGFGGQSLTITGPVSAKLTSSKMGDFRVDHLAPGRYTLHLNSSPGVPPVQDQQAEILPRGCAAVNFYIESASEYKRLRSSMLKAGAKKK